MTGERILVVTGLRREAGLLARACGRTPAGDRSFLIACRGPGADGARRALAEGLARAAAEDARVRLCLSVGFAAALVPALEPGEIVVPSEIVAAPRHWPCARLAEPAAGPPLVPVARLAEAAEPLAAPREKAWLHLTSGAAAADMESAALARACAEEGLAFAALRVISDGASHRLPAWLSGAIDGRGRLRPPALVTGLCANPRDWPAFAALARAGMRAERSLSRLGAALPQIALPFLL